MCFCGRGDTSRLCLIVDGDLAKEDLCHGYTCFRVQRIPHGPYMQMKMHISRSYFTVFESAMTMKI